MSEPLVMSGEFKDSPLGKIPKDWDIVFLNDEINILHGYAFKGEYFADKPPGDVLLVPGNFHREGGLYFDENNTKYYRGAIPDGTVLDNGELLIVMTDLSPRTLILGRVIQVDLPFRVLHNQRIGKIIPKFPDTWDKRFLMLVLNSDRVRRNIIIKATGTTVRHTSPDRIIANVVPKPIVHEQRTIADILDTLDGVIALTESHIAKLKQVKAGLLHDLLTRGIDENGKLRDPIKYPEQFQDSPIGKIPKEWGFGKLSDFYAIPARNGLYKSAKYYGRGVLMIHMPQMFRGLEIDVYDSARVDVSSAELARFSLQPGDLVFARRSLNLEGAGRCSLITDLPELTTFESSIIRVRLSTEQQHPPFINYFLNSELGFRLRLPFIRQVAVSGVSSEDIASIPVPQPHPEEQKRIVNKIKLYETRIQLKEKQREKLKLVKKGLMSDLLTGKVRVKAPITN